MKKDNSYYIIHAIPALAVTVIIFLLPMGSVLLRARNIGATFTDAYTWRLLGFTLLEAGLSAFLSVLIALPFCIFFSRYSFPLRRVLLTISDAAFALPAVLAALGFVIWYGNNGILNNMLAALTGGRAKLRILYSFKAIILAHVYLNFPVALSLITGALSSMPQTEERASRLLGASEFRTFFRITLPKSMGTIVSAFTLIFLFCFPSFLIIMTLGGNPRFFTLEAEIYRRTYTDVNIASSASLAIFSFLIMTLLLVATGYGKETRKAQRSKHHLKKATGGKKLLAIVLSALIILFMAPPMLSILYRAFFTKDNAFTLKAWQSIVARTNSGAGTSLEAIANSLLIAGLSAIIATEMASSISMATVRGKLKLLPLLTSLPMAVGSVSLGLGFAILAARIPFRNKLFSYFLVLLAHTVVIMPFAIRTILPGARHIPTRLPLAAKTLGSDNRRIFRKIEYPMLGNYRKRAFAFAFALSLGEVNATLSLGEGRVTTIPVLIYKLINQYNYQGASALAVVLLTIAIVMFAIGESSKEARSGLS